MKEKIIQSFLHSESFFLPKGQHQIFSDGEGHSLGAFYHPDMKVYGKSVAYFGFWTLPTKDVSDDLFLRFEAWVKELGVHHIVGPIDLSVAINYRLQVDSFELPSFLGEPRTPSYAPSYLESKGYSIAQEYGSCFIDDKSKVQSWLVVNKIEEIVQEFEKTYKFVPLTLDYFNKHQDEFIGLVNEIFADNFCFLPLDNKTIQMIYNPSNLSHFCDQTSYALETIEGKMVGFCLNIKNKDQLLLKTVGVNKEHRQFGLGFLALIGKSLISSLEFYNRWGFCLMKKGNFPSLISQDENSDKRRYCLYEKQL